MMTTHPLRDYRAKAGITQTQLSKILGISYAMVNHIENGRRRITPENAKAWAKLIPIAKSELCPTVFGDDLAA